MIQMLGRPSPPADVETYRGWDIALQWHPAEQGETWGVPGCFVGKLMAVKIKRRATGKWFTIQPLWLTRGQMEKLKSDLDMESATLYLVEQGLRAIKRSIDLYESGAMQPETMPVPPKDLDPATDLNDARLRIKDEPGSAKPPAP